MILTDLERIVLSLAAVAALIVIAGFAADDHIRRRNATTGWTRAANELAHRMGRHRESHNSLVAAHEQLANHVGHLAAEVEHLRDQLAATRRPPSATDTTVRLGPAAAGRTAKLARVDPWPTSDQSPEAMAWRNGSAS